MEFSAVRVSNTPGDSVTTSFVGTGVEYLARKSEGYGEVQVYRGCSISKGWATGRAAHGSAGEHGHQARYLPSVSDILLDTALANSSARTPD
jgi:hypothetical protein